MKNSILLEINNSLETTTKTGEIENILMKDTSRLDHRLLVIEDEWIEIKNTDGFYYFQGAYNIRLVITEMKKWFENLQKHSSKENIKFAENILFLLPIIDSILDIVRKYKISKKSIDRVLNKTGLLRERAQLVKLIDYPSDQHK